jgi:transposase-like protein
MMTRTEAVALRRTWKARAGILMCLHHYLFVERINPRRSRKHFLCMDCGEGVVRRFTPSAENRSSLSSPRWAGKEKPKNMRGYMTRHRAAADAKGRSVPASLIHLSIFSLLRSGDP